MSLRIFGTTPTVDTVTLDGARPNAVGSVIGPMASTTES